MRKMILAAVTAGCLTIGAGAIAAVTFDAGSGSGFVGKGDVQLVFGMNNAQLQKDAESVRFRANSTEVSEVSWVCTNSNNQNVQERERTTTTSVQGVVASVARVKNQVTGFTLSGYSGDPTRSSTTEGNPLNSCPSGPWSLTSPAGDPEIVSSTGGLEVSINGADWYPIDS